MVMGIRAYQWGWEYYYPRDLDLTYDSRPAYAVFLGHSLKYCSTTFLKNNTYTLFRFYQLQNSDSTITPLSLLLSSGDLDNFASMSNFAETGLDSLIEANAFAHVRKISKLPFTTSFAHTSALTADAL
jgi:hypothetical protein